jgi:hypothetical protein
VSRCHWTSQQSPFLIAGGAGVAFGSPLNKLAIQIDLLRFPNQFILESYFTIHGMKTEC